MTAIEYIKTLPEFNEYTNLYQFLRDQDEVTRFDYYTNEHWTDFVQIVKVNDKHIGYVNATTTGDMSIFDVGWNFNESTVDFYHPAEVVTIIYKRSNQ